MIMNISTLKYYGLDIPFSVAQSVVSVINMIRYCKEFYIIDNKIDAQLNNEINKLESLGI